MTVHNLLMCSVITLSASSVITLGPLQPVLHYQFPIFSMLQFHVPVLHATVCTHSCSRSTIHSTSVGHAGSTPSTVELVHTAVYTVPNCIFSRYNRSDVRVQASEHSSESFGTSGTGEGHRKIPLQYTLSLPVCSLALKAGLFVQSNRAP